MEIYAIYIYIYIYIHTVYCIYATLTPGPWDKIHELSHHKGQLVWRYDQPHVDKRLFFNYVVVFYWLLFNDESKTNVLPWRDNKILFENMLNVVSPCFLDWIGFNLLSLHRVQVQRQRNVKYRGNGMYTCEDTIPIYSYIFWTPPLARKAPLPPVLCTETSPWWPRTALKQDVTDKS